MLQICGGTSTHVMDRDSDHKISHDPSFLCYDPSGLFATKVAKMVAKRMNSLQLLQPTRGTVNSRPWSFRDVLGLSQSTTKNKS